MFHSLARVRAGAVASRPNAADGLRATLSHGPHAGGSTPTPISALKVLD